MNPPATHLIECALIPVDSRGGTAGSEKFDRMSCCEQHIDVQDWVRKWLGFCVVTVRIRAQGAINVATTA